MKIHSNHYAWIYRHLTLAALLTLLTACGGGDNGGGTTNTNPTVSAGTDQSVIEGTIVQLSGSGSDAEGPVSYSWAQTAGTVVSLSSTTIPNPSFTAPQVTGQDILVFSLTVTDSDGVSVSDTVQVTVNDDTPPTANAGPDQTVAAGSAVQLSGTGTDAEGPVTYSWAQTAGTAVSLSNTAIANPGFTAPQVTGQDILEFTLTVTDSNNVSVTDTVQITVLADAPPTANAGPDQTVTEGTTVQLSGTGTDAEGPVTYSWAQTAGTAVSLSNAAIANPSFTAPQVTGQDVLEFTLTVTDSNNVSISDTVLITVNDTPVTSQYYLFYTNDLNAVDPANPGSPILIEPTANLITAASGTPNEVIRVGDFNSTTSTITNVHNYAMIYVKTDGRFYRVNALINGPITPVQVSSENQADQICVGAIGGTSNRPDLANPENSQYLYALPGTDGNCDTTDDVWKMIRIGMSPTDTPVNAFKPLVVLTDLSTGAIAGWLVHDNGNLSRCDASFANCTTVTATTNEPQFLIQTDLDHYLFNIDSMLYVYNSTTNTLSSAVYNLVGGPITTIPTSDGTTVFFGFNNQIYSFPADGSATASLLHTEAENIQLRMLVTSNRLIYSLGGFGLATSLKSLPKNGGPAITLATPASGDNVLLYAISGSNIYYNFQNYSTVNGLLKITPVASGMVDENGNNKTETTLSAWSGTHASTTIDLSQGNNPGFLVEAIVRSDGFDIPTTGGGYAGATLTAFDAATATATLTLGTLPTTGNIAGIACSDFGNNALCSATYSAQPTPGLQNDIYFINAVTANSLQRVTNTPTLSEIKL